jgi:hypothetical protein
VRLVGGVFGAADEAAQELLGFGGAELEPVAYLTSSSYCWAISGQLTVRAEIMGAIAAHGLSVPMPGA